MLRHDGLPRSREAFDSNVFNWRHRLLVEWCRWQFQVILLTPSNPTVPSRRNNSRIQLGSRRRHGPSCSQSKDVLDCFAFTQWLGARPSLIKKSTIHGSSVSTFGHYLGTTRALTGTNWALNSGQQRSTVVTNGQARPLQSLGFQ